MLERPLQPTGPISSAAFVLTWACIMLILVAAVVLFLENASYFNPCEFGPLFGTASAVILLGMFGLYRYAYKFYEDDFYQFISLGWLLNATYIFFETFFRSNQADFKYHLEVYGIGLINSLPFYFATFVPPGGPTRYRQLLISTGKWLIWLVGSFILIFWLVMIRFPEIDDQTKFVLITLGGIPFSVWSLFKVARALESRLNKDTHKEWAFIFPLTFYLYAALQPLYLLKLWPGMEDIFKGFFSGALIIKVVNSVAALSIIRADTAQVQRLLEQRTVLEDLGALTASIEHDIKNPLEVIDNELKSLRNRHQANDEIMAFIKRLDEQRLRIFATTQIIPVLRGQRDYYEQYMQKTDIGALISASIKAVKREMNTQQDIIFKADDDRIFHVKSYRPMLEQAIVNILKNAVEGIREAKRTNGLITVQLKLEYTDEEETIRIDFRDNGCGIPEEQLPEVTKLFMSTRTNKKPNSGIGLFITKRILKVHNGKLTIRNNERQGVTVSIFLPLWNDNGKRR